MSIQQSQQYRNKKSGIRGNEEKNSTLYILGIPPELTENALRNLFSTFGNVTLVNILPPKHGQTCKAGFVEFENLVQAELAIKSLNGFKLGEYTLKVEKAKPRKLRCEEGNKNDYLSLIQKLEKGPLLQKELLDITNNNNAGSYKNPLVSESFSGSIEESSNKCSLPNAVPEGAQNQGSTLKDKRNPCHVCGQLTKSMCSSCSSVFYCSRNCQVKDWSKHKLNCNRNNSRKSESLENDEDSDSPLIVVDSSICNQFAKHLKAVSKQSSAIICNGTKVQAVCTKINSFTSQISCGDLIRFSVTDVDAKNACFICQSVMPNDIVNLNELQVGLNEFYNDRNASKVASPKVGNFVAAVYAEDGQWYRAVIESVSPDDKALVKFIDYGNKELVNFTDLYVLKEMFCTQSAFSVNCKLNGMGSEPWNEKALECILSALSGSNLIIDACIAEVMDGVVYAEVKANGVGIAENLLRIACVSPIAEIGKSKNDESVAEQTNPNMHHLENEMEQKIQNHDSKLKDVVEIAKNGFDLLPMKIPDGSFQIIISHTVCPDSIFCQLIQSGLYELQTQFKELTQICNSNKVSSWIPRTGDICAAMFPEDNVWYRAKVVGLKKEKDVVKVQFVDFGNTEMIPNHLIQQLPSQFALLPVQAFEASLSGCYAKDDTWSKDCISLIKEWQNKSFLARVEGTCANTGKPSLTVFVDEKSTLNELLVKEKHVLKVPYAKTESDVPKFEVCQTIEKQKPPLGVNVDIIITECNQPGEFFCQLVTQQLQQLAETLQDLTKHCKEAPSFPTECLPEMFCSALFKDGMWYRAQVKQVDDNTIFVEYVDYGNSALISKHNVQLLPAKFGSLPVQAFKCNLADASPVCDEGWGEDFINVTQNFVGKCIHAQIVSCDDDDMLFIKVPNLLNSLIVEKCALYCF
uniref:Tudor domain-containing protein 1-like n=1 Tax=Phallusia mammillata TaxID=59560 RepID=A0A6F9DTX7_9ASCI|nr:tudor domain-containing protein 1-like [Phallusia mammillata]